MRELTLTLAPGKRPRYLKIADAVRGSIQSRRIAPGEALPSTRSLGRDLKTNRHTVMSAFDELVAEGWLAVSARSGYRVNESLPSRFFEAARPPAVQGRERRHEWRFARAAPAWTPAPAARYAFRSGQADLRLFPHDEFKSCVVDALRLSRGKVLEYGDPIGHPPLIDELKTYLRRVRAVSDREIVVTHGSQEAIYLAAQLLIKPGDAVAVERLGYPPAWEALKAAGARLVPIDIDNEGLDPDSFARAIKRHRLRLLYTTPLHQYPTTVTLPISRRLRLYELASRAGVPILEDDYDHEFHYRSQPLAPLASQDPDGRVIYISTFSKVLFPSARIGFMAVPRSLAAPLAGYKKIISRQNETVLQDALARWMRAGGFERHLRKMRRRYDERRICIEDSLTRAKQAGLPLQWRTPDGGMAVWVGVGTDADRLAHRAAQAGVHIQSGSHFTLRKSASRHLRLGFANQSPSEIESGMELLFEAIRSKA
ncbi:MAG: PLP-dependent aminotransferase family protein [Elusimicrobia bacterium]|nr:PLP-dependent aminotransferase family protein [Elusimicrobiota bacterium]